jgi:Ca2+-binding RTX toxin-like protein
MPLGRLNSKGRLKNSLVYGGARIATVGALFGLVAAFAAGCGGGADERKAAISRDARHDLWPTTKCNYRGAADRTGARRGSGPGCGVYRSHPDDQNGVLQGTSRIDELLGGHGNDLIYGSNGPDVIWGDFKPCCQPNKQKDRLRGGAGNDHIYASHGTNNIKAGPGNDRVHAHFGHSGSSVDCGSGNDIIFLSKQRKSHFNVRNCEHISFALNAP